MKPRFLALALGAVIAAPGLQAQGGTNGIVTGGATVGEIRETPPANPASPGECAQDLRAYHLKNLVDLGFFSAENVPKDSVRKNVENRAKACVDKFPLSEVKGKQLDYLGIVYVRANQDKVAQDIFTRRLGESGITAREKQLTLLAAVEAFADGDVPERIATAEKYMKELDALPADATSEKVKAHGALTNAYRRVNNDPKVIEHGEQVVKLAQNMDQRDRAESARHLELSFQDVSELYSIEASGGKDKIEALAKILQNPKFPDPSYIAEFFQRAVDRSRMLNTVAPKITANWWLNMGDKKGYDELDIASDKKLRVLQFAAFG